MPQVKKRGSAPRRRLPALIPPAPDVNIIAKEPTAYWMTITPDMAASWLDESNLNNRTLRDFHIGQLAADMGAGKWKKNGETIQFDKTGRLVNGQHRLYACVESKAAFECLVVLGIEPEDYSSIDVGKTKTFGDFLGPIYSEKNVMLLGASVKLVYLWNNGRLGAKYSPSISELEKTYLAHPKLAASVNAVASMVDTRKLLTASFAVLIHYAGTLGNNHARVEDFLEKLGNGVGLYENNPVYHLRKFLLKERVDTPGHRRSPQPYILALAIKAWNAYKNEEKLKALRFSPSEEFPDL